MKIDKFALEKILVEEIPITTAIGINVSDISNNTVILTAPLSNNINHKHTAFGGSLYSVAVLAGWSLLYVQLNELELASHIVIQEGNMKYLHPVKDEISACANLPSNENFQRFIRMYNKKGLSRIQLKVAIHQGNKLAAELTGTYVIHV